MSRPVGKAEAEATAEPEQQPSDEVWPLRGRLPLDLLGDLLIEQVSPVRDDSPQDESPREDPGSGSLVPQEASEEDLVMWLTGIFKERNKDQSQRTVTALASCLQAGYIERSQALVRFAREDIIRMSAESWQLLQNKDLESTDGFGKPGHPPTPLRKSQGSSVMEDDHLSSGARSPRSGKTTASTTGSPWMFFGASSSGTATGAAVSALSLASFDLEDRHSSNASLSPRLEDAHTDSGNQVDDWEYEFMLNAIFEQVLYRLNAGRTVEAVNLLEEARDRVVRWTVSRWMGTS